MVFSIALSLERTEMAIERGHAVSLAMRQYYSSNPVLELMKLSN